MAILTGILFNHKGHKCSTKITMYGHGMPCPYDLSLNKKGRYKPTFIEYSLIIILQLLFSQALSEPLKPSERRLF
jgi:hypothetical protein